MIGRNLKGLGLAALLGAPSAGPQVFTNPWRSPKAAPAKPRSQWYRAVRTSSLKPKGDPLAAQAKRERKATKLTRDALRARVNPAWACYPLRNGENGQPVIKANLHMLYVNREVA